MTGDPRIAPILRDLAFLEDHYEDLVDSRIPGTQRPWREPTMTAERKAELAEEARRERAIVESDLPFHLRPVAQESLGESPAPMHVDVLDVIVDLLVIADETAEHVAQVAGVDRLPSAPSAFASPLPYLRFIAQNVTAAVEADPDMAEVVAGNIRPMVGAVAQSLSLLRDGQVLKAACFVCHGRTPEFPAGGAFTLRVTTTTDDVPAVVCRNPLCEPTEEECGTWLRGAPAWILPEWDWLAKRLEGAA